MRPAARTSDTRARNSRCISGSRPLDGSSRMISGASPMNACTTPTFWRLPRDSLRICTDGSSSRRSATARHAPFGGPAAAPRSRAAQRRSARRGTPGRCRRTKGARGCGQRRPTRPVRRSSPARRSVGAARGVSDRGRLAGAVRPEEPEDLPLVDRERDLGDASPPSVGLGKSGGLDDARHPPVLVRSAHGLVSRTASRTG